MTAADGSFYDDDFCAWTQLQAELLRRGAAAAYRLDYDLIAEEIEDLGQCPYSLEQILGNGDEDWFPTPRQS
jgi:hypothetical protein